MSIKRLKIKSGNLYRRHLTWVQKANVWCYNLLGKKWRLFKINLTTDFILPFKDKPHPLKEPPSLYSFITKPTWDIFVNSRLTEAWELKHSIQSERGKQNEYNHLMPRKGYAGLKDEYKKEKPDEVLDRSKLWILVRQDKNGNIPDPKVAEKANKINELTTLKAEGELETSGSNDVLTLALGTPGHGGGVRGIGGYVKPSSYFNTPRFKGINIQESIREAVRVVLEEERQKMMQKTEQPGPS